MLEYSITNEFREQLNELVQQLNLFIEQGGIFLIGLSGPLARKALDDELPKILTGIHLKRISWKKGLKDLSELFPKARKKAVVYIVDGLDKVISSEGEKKIFSLLNLTREFYSRQKISVVYRMPTDLLFKELQWKATDFWSFRSATFDFLVLDDYQVNIEEIKKRLINVETIPEKIENYRELLNKVKSTKKDGEPAKLAALFSELGELDSKAGRFDQALEYFQNALKLYKKINDRRNESRQTANIGKVYLLMRQPQKASNYIREAINIAKELGDGLLEAYYSELMGQSFVLNGNMDKALIRFESALKQFREMDHHRGEIWQLLNIALTYTFEEDYDYGSNFLKNLKKKIDEGAGVIELDMYSMRFVADILCKKGDRRIAFKLYNELLGFSRILGYRNEEVAALEGIAKIYEYYNLPEKALQFHREARKLV